MPPFAHGQVVTDMPPFAHGQVVTDMPSFAHGQVVTDMPPFAHEQVVTDMPYFAHLFSGKLQFGHGQVFTTIVTRLSSTDILLASPQFVMLESFH